MKLNVEQIMRSLEKEGYNLSPQEIAEEFLIYAEAQDKKKNEAYLNMVHAVWDYMDQVLGETAPLPKDEELIEIKKEVDKLISEDEEVSGFEDFFKSLGI